MGAVFLKFSWRAIAWGALAATWVFPASAQDPALTAASEQEVKRFCGYCHAYPPPELFSKRQWKLEVDLGYTFYRDSGLSLDPPLSQQVLKFYRDRAPENMPELKKAPRGGESPFRFERIGYRGAGELGAAAISNVHAVHLFDTRRLDILATDLLRGDLMLLRPYEKAPQLQTIAKGLASPCHVEVVDLDGDGIQDLIVACLGVFFPSNEKHGSVVWLRGGADGQFTPVTLASGLGRVADVQAADFDGDGKLDLVVAEFGWRTVGEILLLENRTSDWSDPHFVPKTLDPRHGAIHVPVVDLNADGRPDFIALISQEHETVVAFLNEGEGNFRRETIYAAPQPAFGSSGIQLVDLDGDGDLDVLYTNGDSLDRTELRAWHGVSWLENRGEYPFRYHRLADLCGVHRALAADFDGDGDLDIVAVTFLPERDFSELRTANDLDAIVLLEQTRPGEFVRHSLTTVTCDHATCDLGDFDGDGNVDFVTGNFINFGPKSVGRPIASDSKVDWITVWKNVSPQPGGRSKNGARK